MFIIDELYVSGCGVEEIAVMIRRKNVGRQVIRYMADPQHAFSKTMQSPVPIAGQFEKQGFNFGPWNTSGTHSEAMVNEVRAGLIATRDGEENKLKVFDCCTNTIAEFESWMFKRNTKGERMGGDDQYEDKNNHAMDVCKGIIASGIRGLRPGEAGKIIEATPIWEAESGVSDLIVPRRKLVDPDGAEWDM